MKKIFGTTFVVSLLVSTVNAFAGHIKVTDLPTRDQGILFSRQYAHCGQLAGYFYRDNFGKIALGLFFLNDGKNPLIVNVEDKEVSVDNDTDGHIDDSMIKEEFYKKYQSFCDVVKK